MAALPACSDATGQKLVKYAHFMAGKCTRAKASSSCKEASERIHINSSVNINMIIQQ